MVATPYGNTADCRELARSVLAIDFSDAEIIEEQIMAQSKIWTVTRKTDWDASDSQFEYIKKLEIKQAAIYVLEHYNVVDILPVLNGWQAEINEGLKTVSDSISDPTLDEPIKVIASSYESFPANLQNSPEGTIYRSTSTAV